MATGKQSSTGGLLRELTHADIYKRSQGRWTRQVTGVTLAVLIGMGAWNLGSVLPTFIDWLVGNEKEEIAKLKFSLGVLSVGLETIIAVVFVMLGLWISYRIVNIPKFADFLIAVEAEMNKVTWPTRSELWRSSLVVIVTMFVLAAVLFGYDAFWQWLLGHIM